MSDLFGIPARDPVMDAKKLLLTQVKVGQRYERDGILVIVDSVTPTEVFYRRWRSGSDGSPAGDWHHFLGAGLRTIDDFLAQVVGLRPVE